MKIFSCQQLFQKDCGFAAIKMLASYLEQNRTFLYAPLGKEGPYSFFDLSIQLEAWGFSVEACRASDFAAVEPYLPAVFLIQQGENFHFVVLLRQKKSRLLMLNPNGETRGILRKDFVTLWTGEFLSAKKQQPSKIHFPSPKKERKFLVIAMLETFSFSLFFFTLQASTIALIFLFFTVSFYVLRLFLLFRYQKSMDRRLLFPYLAQKRTDEATVQEFFVLKKEMTLWQQAVFPISSTFLCMLFFLFTCNAGWILLLLLLFLCGFSWFVDTCILDSTKKQFDEKSSKSLQEKTLLLNQKAYHYAYSVLGFKAISVLLAFLGSAFYVAIALEADLMNILFYMAMLLFATAKFTELKQHAVLQQKVDTHWNRFHYLVRKETLK